MPSPSASVWVICEGTTAGDLNLVEAHTTSKGALAAASKLGSCAQVKEVALKKAKKESDAEGDKVKTPKNAANGDDDGDELARGSTVKPNEVDWEEDAVPDSLAGLKLIFTGTFDKNRDECNAIAKKYGAAIVAKPEDADYVIMGTRPGQKKVQEIQAKGLETTDQEGFLDMLEMGVPREKRDHIAVAAGREVSGPPAKKQKN